MAGPWRGRAREYVPHAANEGVIPYLPRSSGALVHVGVAHTTQDIEVEAIKLYDDVVAMVTGPTFKFPQVVVVIDYANVHPCNGSKENCIQCRANLS